MFAEDPKVILDFTAKSGDASAWAIPTADTKDTKTYSNGSYSIVLSATNAYKFSSKDKYLLLGQTGSYMQLPTFDFVVSKIIVYGRSGASTGTKMNIFVGETAVSAETTGSVSANTYMISNSYQTVGTEYVLRVLNAKNAQITKVEIYELKAGAPANPTFSVPGGIYLTEQSLVLSTTPADAKIYYTTDGSDPTASSIEYTDAITIDTNMTIKAVAIKDGIASSIISNTYSILLLDGDGSKENPFSVSDVKVLNNSLTGKQWVEGTIVGVYKNNKPTTEVGAADSTNLAIAFGTDTIPVQLAANTAARKELNVVNNNLIGAVVKILGDLVAYFSTPGVKNLTDFEIVSTPTALEETEQITTNPNAATKFVENGRIYIEHNGERYTLLGSVVQ